MKEVSALGELKQSHDGSWSRAQCTFAFPVDHVDVWRVSLDEPLRIDFIADVLSPDEIARAGRFHFERDRVRFSLCRSALRNLLASYLAIRADEIRFNYQTGGKPQLALDQNPRGLQFNVSHSADMALIAIGGEHRLGVDIEKLRYDTDTASLAERFFSCRERAGLRALPDHQRVPGFLACWTRKEAFLKATGDGLSFPLADFSVTTHPDLDPELEDIQGKVEAAQQWFLADLKVVGGYRAAIAIEHAYARLDTYAWN
jgi:4'-phosphopantetheinyl transferase